jgi:hypothetical protein
MTGIRFSGEMQWRIGESGRFASETGEIPPPPKI